MSAAGGSTAESGERGGVMLEVALTVGLVAFLLSASFDALRLVYTYMMSEYAVAAVLRTGVVEGNGDSRSRGSALEQRVIERMREYGIEVPTDPLDPLALVNNPHVTICSPGNGGPCTSGAFDEAGEESQVIEIRIDLPVSVFFHETPYALHVSVFGRNEPFRSVEASS